MRSKLSTFGFFAVVAMLCTVVVAAPLKNRNLAAKNGRFIGTEAVTPAPNGNLPPVGSRGSHSLDEVIISEDFEAYAFGQLPPGWTQVDVDQGTSPVVAGPSRWQVFGGSGYPAHGGTKVVANFYNSPAVPNDDWLILPQQNLSGTITLSYWVSSQDALYLESYQVKVSTTGNQPANFTNLVADINDTPAPWTQRTHDLSTYAGAPFWIAFHYDATDEFVIKIDDILLEGTQAGEFGNISGTVTDDATQAPVVGVFVTVIGTTDTATTNASGVYTINDVMAGSYDLAFTQVVYESDSLLDVAVTANNTTTANIALHRIPGLYLFTSTEPPQTINDLDTARMELTVDEDRITLDVDVIVNITHTYDGDLDLWLEAPWGQRLHLVENSNISGDNFINTRFDDEAELSFVEGSPPYTGSYTPLEPLSNFDGYSSLGDWALIAYDNALQDVGTIDNFSLLLTLEGEAAGAPVTVPQSFAFHGNYPNPFNATTQFRFDMARTGHASLVLYNITGQEIVRLVDGELSVGEHTIAYNAASLPSGLYFARFDAPGYTSTRKMILLK